MFDTQTQSKYDIIWNGSKNYKPYTQEDSEYATFLKNLERTCSNKGYLDSKLYTQKLTKEEVAESLNSPKENIPIKSFDVAKRHQKFNDEYEVKMKKISQELLQEKRQERLLKRKEGDIIKQNYNLNKSFQKFESDINSKKFQEEIKLRNKADNFETNRKKFYCQKAMITKDRMRSSMKSHIDNMGKTRRSTLNLSRLMREYNAKKNEVDISSKEIHNLMETYEKKLAIEENKNRQLLKELKSISESLNMEKMKLKTQEIQLESDKYLEKEMKHEQDQEWEKSYMSFVNDTDDGIKSAEMHRKILDSELAKCSEENAVKSCKYGGSLTTVRHKLHQSENNQRQLIEQAKYLNLIMQKSEYDVKVENADVKRTQIIQSRQREVAEENRSRDQRSLIKTFQSQAEKDLQNEADNVVHMKNTIKREKEMEQRLYKSMNDTAKDIKQQSILISRLSKSLKQLDEKESARLNDESRQYNKKIQSLIDEINREKTKLHELQITRDYHFNELVDYRKQLKTDELELKRSKLHQSRLEQIIDKSDDIQDRSSLPQLN